jgi:hypothetical protein
MSYLGNHLTQQKWTLGLDPFDYDGVIIPEDDSKLETQWKRGLVVEQTYMIHREGVDFVEAFRKSVAEKVSKGRSYAKNLNLLVLSEYGRKEELSSVISIAQESIFESVYLFVLKMPVPYKFFAAILKSPADPLQFCEISINPANGSAKVIPRGSFRPV